MSQLGPHLHQGDATREILRGLCQPEYAGSWEYHSVSYRDQHIVLHDAVVDANTAAARAFQKRGGCEHVWNVDCAEHFHFDFPAGLGRAAAQRLNRNHSGNCEQPANGNLHHNVAGGAA